MSDVLVLTVYFKFSNFLSQILPLFVAKIYTTFRYSIVQIISIYLALILQPLI